MQPKLLLLFLAPESEVGPVAVRTCFDHDGKKKKRRGTQKKNASKCSGCLMVMKYASSELLNEWHQRKPENKIGKNIGTHSTEETGSKKSMQADRDAAKRKCKNMHIRPQVRGCRSIRSCCHQNMMLERCDMTLLKKIAVRTLAGLLAELEPRREVLVVAAAVEGAVVGLAVQLGASLAGSFQTFSSVKNSVDVLTPLFQRKRVGFR